MLEGSVEISYYVMIRGFRLIQFILFILKLLFSDYVYLSLIG